MLKTSAEIEAEARAGEAENAALEAASLAAVSGKTKGRARAMAKTPPASSDVKAVAGAAKGPPNEKMAGGKAAQVGDMDAAPAAAFDKAAFIAAIEAKINAQAPKSLEEADGYEKSGALETVKVGIKDSAGGAKERASGAVDQATEKDPDPDRGSETPGGALAPASTPRAPAPAGAAGAMPKQKPPAATDLSGPKNETDAEMAQAGVTEEQLANSNEPQFTGALDTKKQGEHHSTTAPGPVRAAEAKTLAQAAGAAKTSERGALSAMLGSRKSANAAVDAEKTAKKSENEGARAAVAAKIEAIYTQTQSATKAILDGIDAKVDAEFTSGERTARAAFENKYKSDLERFMDKRYSGLRGKGRWLKDKLYKPPAEVGRIIDRARQLYIAAMGKVVNAIADLVGKELTAAKTRVADGRKEINEYVASLPQDLQKQGAELAKGVQGKLDALNAEVDAKQNELVDKIADQYKSAREEVDARVEQMRAENMGLWERAKAAIVGVITTILALKDALMSALKKASNAITKIIKDPIGFLNNLISAFTSGLKLFMSNIKKHLVGGVISWLTGALGGAGISLPEKFDIKGVVDLVLQVLGVTRENIRTRILRKLGPAGAAVMGRVEQGVALVTQIISGGPVALWQLILEKVGNLKDMVLGKIQDFIEESVIAQGIQWLMSLINPAAAFIKACKMIIDGVMWLWNNAARIIELIDTIAGSALAIAQGSIGTAAAKIEQVLARLTPTLISFFASLLGLGGIAGKVKEIINVVRRPINKVIDKVVGKAVKFGRKLMKSKLGQKLKGGIDKGRKWVKDKVDKAKKLGEKAVQKVKKKIYGGDDSPDGKKKRETKALEQGVTHLDKWAGSKVKMAVALPGLMAIKLKNGLKVFDLIPMGRFWGLDARVDRMADTSKAGRDTTDDESPGAGHAKWIGTDGAYNELGSKQSESPGLEREHIIPREAYGLLLAALGGWDVPSDSSGYKTQPTILVYQAAARLKTKKDPSDSDMKSEIDPLVKRIDNRKTLQNALKRVVARWKQSMVDATWSGVQEENVTEPGGKTRGTVDDPRPRRGQIVRTANKQEESIKELLGESYNVLDKGGVVGKVAQHIYKQIGGSRIEYGSGNPTIRFSTGKQGGSGDGTAARAIFNTRSNDWWLQRGKRGKTEALGRISLQDPSKTASDICAGVMKLRQRLSTNKKKGYTDDYKKRAVERFVEAPGDNPTAKALATLEVLDDSETRLRKPAIGTIISWAREAGVAPPRRPRVP